MEDASKAIFVGLALILGFVYFLVAEVNKESALTTLRSTRGEIERLVKVLATRKSYLKEKQNLRLSAEASKKTMTEPTARIEALRVSEEAESVALRDAQVRIKDAHKECIDAVRATVGGFVGTKTASIRLKSNKTLTNLTLTAATEEALTFSHDAGITKVMNAELSDESRALFGLPDHRELTQILEEYRNTELAGQSQSEPPPASSAEIAALEAQLAAVQVEHDKLQKSARTLPGSVQDTGSRSRKAIADKLNERVLELQTLIKSAKGQP